MDERFRSHLLTTATALPVAVVAARGLGGMVGFALAVATCFGIGVVNRIVLARQNESSPAPTWLRATVPLLLLPMLIGEPSLFAGALCALGLLLLDAARLAPLRFQRAPQEQATETDDQPQLLLFDSDAAESESFFDNEQPFDQRSIRQTDDEGGSMVAVEVRTSFAFGEQRRVLHIPLWPPLPGAVEADAFVVDSESVTARVTESKPWGVRVELRRRSAIDAETVLVSVTLFAAGESNASQQRLAG